MVEKNSESRRIKMKLILQTNKYAKGEITKDELEEIKRNLK